MVPGQMYGGGYPQYGAGQQDGKLNYWKRLLSVISRWQVKYLI